MELPPRPSRPLHSPGVDRAQGTFREALAALRNLSNLVRSRNVGPRAILDLVPDVQSACKPLPQAAADVFAVVEPYLDPAPLGELKSFVLERCGRLAEELEAAARGSMNARQRLHLEQVLGDLWRDLNGARALLGMLESSVSELDLPSDLVELLLQTYSGPPSVGQVQSLIPAGLDAGELELPIDKPRTVAALVSCATELVAREGAPAQVTVTASGGVWRATFAPVQTPRGIPLTIWGYGAVAPGLSCLRVAAQRVGIGVSWNQQQRTLVLEGKYQA